MANGNKTRVFVYGTLKENHGNHAYYLAGNPEVKKLGRCYITGDFRMYSNGAFPVVTRGNSEATRKIVGEVYEVDEETLFSLDILEGHPEWYHRIKVDTPWKKAWVYVMDETTARASESAVESGCFNASDEEKEWMRGTATG